MEHYGKQRQAIRCLFSAIVEGGPKCLLFRCFKTENEKKKKKKNSFQNEFEARKKGVHSMFKD